MTPEKLIQNNILAWLKVACWGKGLFFPIYNGGVPAPGGRIKRHGGNNRRLYLDGVSDIIGIYRGQMIVIEVKSAKGKLTTHQEMFLNEINRHGGHALVARSISDVQQFIKEIDDGIRHIKKEESQREKEA